MELHIRDVLFRHHKDAEVGDEQCVDADLLQVAQVVGQAAKVAVVREDVDRHIDLLLELVGEPDRLAQLFSREVAAERAQAVELAAEVDGVGAVEQRHLHLLEIPCWGQELRLFHHVWYSSDNLFDSFAAGQQRETARPSPRSKISVS